MERTIPALREQDRREKQHAPVQLSRTEIYSGHLVLVNRTNPVKHPLPLDLLAPLSAHPDLATLRQDMFMEQTALQHFLRLLEACQGLEEIIAVSGYRTREEQAQIYASSLQENGAAYTASYVALPDQSEHQTGLAIDVGLRTEEVDFIAPDFPDSGVCLRFKQLAAQYGFIQRYQEGQERLTHISCEPWHFRYVGYPHAKLMEQYDLCLETYIDWIQDHPYTGVPLTFEDEAASAAIYYVPAATGASTSVPILSCDRYTLSGNNRDGFIVTAITGTGQRELSM